MFSGSPVGRLSPATIREPGAEAFPSGEAVTTTPCTNGRDPENNPAAGGLPQVVALSSRPPVVRTNGRWVTAPGGLAPIVRRAVGERGGAWVSWNGPGGDAPPRDAAGSDFQLLTFTLPRRDADGFYGGYANRTLWPLLHDVVAPPVLDPSWWKSYENAADLYALTTKLALDQLAGEATVWVHDYHLLLVPERLRALGVANPVSFFLHTPFPAPSVFARLPQREQLLQGLSGATLVGFHTEGDRQRFTAAWSQFGIGPAPATAAVPASVDAAAFRDAASATNTLRRADMLRRRFAGRTLLLGIERLDYTKGIPERLLAIETLLDRRPDLRRRIVYIQLAQPSRQQVPEYRELRARVEREIGRLNGKFTTPGGDVIFRYLHRGISQTQLMAYYVAADVAVVTPLRDGMNLVAKEYVVAQSAAKGGGVLVLSEFAGAAAELTDAVQCNPYDIEGTSRAIEYAVEMSEDERRKRLSVMAVHIENNDIEHWADQLLRSVERQPA